MDMKDWDDLRTLLAVLRSGLSAVRLEAPAIENPAARLLAQRPGWRCGAGSAPIVLGMIGAA
jgi:hypothetical protein